MGETVFDSYDGSDNSGWVDEGAEYSPKSEFSKPKVIEEATSKCFQLRSKEMRAGYFNTKITKEGLPIKMWVEDSRKSYCSAVIALKNLMNPEIMYDQSQEGQTLKYKDVNLKEPFEKYAYAPFKKKIVDGKVKYYTGDEKFMPEVDATVQMLQIYPDGQEKLIDSPAKWNNNVQRYWDEMVELCDEMFKELMNVIHRLNYFKQQIRYG